MSNFTPAHLGKWESLFTDLVDGEGSALTEEGTWMLGEKPGLVCVFEDDEPLYIEAAANISKTLQCYIKGGAECDFRNRRNVSFDKERSTARSVRPAVASYFKTCREVQVQSGSGSSEDNEPARRCLQRSSRHSLRRPQCSG